MLLNLQPQTIEIIKSSSLLLQSSSICFFSLFRRIIIVAIDVAIIDYDKSVHSIELLWIYKLVYLGIVGGEYM